jgi:hypothetical protein
MTRASIILFLHSFPKKLNHGVEHNPLRTSRTLIIVHGIAERPSKCLSDVQELVWSRSRSASLEGKITCCKIQQNSVTIITTFIINFCW